VIERFPPPTDWRTRRSPRSGGFTVIELIAVIVVSAILAAVAFPSLANLDETRATVAAKDLLRDVMFARQRAVATGTRTWVVVDAAAETWTIKVEDPLNPGSMGAQTITDPATGQPYVRTLAAGAFEGVTIVGVNFDATASVGFDWLGEPVNASAAALAATGTVTLTGNHRVTVAPLTGHAEYVSPP
jgi:MSHA pilin protein MshC